MSQPPRVSIEQVTKKGKAHYEVYVDDKKVFVTDERLEAKLFADRLKSVCNRCKKE
jgi:hypothetical protein